MVIVAFGFGTSIYFINQNIDDAHANPIMTTIDTVDVKNVPFPAVTVLPGTSVSEKMTNVSSNLL